MKYVMCVMALVAGLCAAPAMAENGNVSQGTLAAMGLGDLAPMSDAQGQDVKGKFAFAASISASAVPGSFNVSPAFATGNYVAFATSGSQSSATFTAFGGGFFGPVPFGFAGFGVYANYSVQSSGYAFAAGF